MNRRWRWTLVEADPSKSLKVVADCAKNSSLSTVSHGKSLVQISCSRFGEQLLSPLRQQKPNSFLPGSTRPSLPGSDPQNIPHVSRIVSSISFCACKK